MKIKKHLVPVGLACASLLGALIVSTTPAEAATYGETTGGVANTWTNYTNAGGYEGPQIGAYQMVQIACKLQGFVVADGNPWWYQIASAPWNYGYYVSADPFYNNGQTSGSLHGTPWFDPAVPDCGANPPPPQPTPRVTLAQGPAAPSGYRYAITLSGFPGNSTIGISCRDSVDPGGFYSFGLLTNGNGQAFTQSYCYSGDGPDHWVIANGVESNHVSWNAPVTPPPSPSPTPQPQPQPQVALSQGPSAPGGYWYAIGLSGFPANTAVGVSCRDSVDPGGFRSFTLTTSGSGQAATQHSCYSGDGPDHWVLANGIESNHVSWGGGSPGGGGGSGGGGGGSTSPPPGPAPGPSYQELSSIHWAGYGASGSNFTFVQATWTVPKVTCVADRSFVSIWAGIDGLAANDSQVLQAGSDAYCASAGGQPKYRIWWETAPLNVEQIVGSVSPGDVVTAAVRYHPNSSAYSMGIVVNGNTVYGRTGYFAAMKSSAECIVEAPVSSGILPLAKFEPVTFSRCVAAQNNATTGPQLGAGSTASYTVYRIDDTKLGKKATTSAPSPDGSQWTVNWYAS